MANWNDTSLSLGEALNKIGAEKYFSRYEGYVSSNVWCKFEDAYSHTGWKLYIYVSRDGKKIEKLEFSDPLLCPATTCDKKRYDESRKLFKKYWDKLERFMTELCKNGDTNEK